MRADGRIGGWADRALLALVLLSAHPAIRLSAQVEVHLSAGARATTTLVHDVIVSPLDVRPGLAPTLAFSILERTTGPWTPDLTIDISRSQLKRYDTGGRVTDLGALTTVAVTVGLRRELAPGVSARAGVGGLKYLPGDQGGIFKDGVSLAAVGSLGVDWTPPFAARRFGLAARYDAHRFITPALRSVGFLDARIVHRLAVAISARLWGAGGGAP